MTSHECNEFVGTTPTTHALSFRAESRNLLLTENWRTADSSSLRLLGMTRSKVSSPASTNPKPLSFRAKREAFDQELENSRLLVASLLGMTRRRFEVGSRGSNPSFLKKKGCKP